MKLLHLMLALNGFKRHSHKNEWQAVYEKNGRYIVVSHITDEELLNRKVWEAEVSVINPYGGTYDTQLLYSPERRGILRLLKLYTSTPTRVRVTRDPKNGKFI